jgi:hypothetical protein
MVRFRVRVVVFIESRFVVEGVSVFVEFEVAVPHLRPAGW